MGGGHLSEEEWERIFRLRLHFERGKRITEPAATAIPRCPRLTRAGFAFLGHGSSLTFNMKRHLSDMMDQHTIADVMARERSPYITGQATEGNRHQRRAQARKNRRG